MSTSNQPQKHKKCYRCKFAGQAFKVGNLTHHHCMKPFYQQQFAEGNSPSPWETLVEWYFGCDEFQARETPINQPRTAQNTNA